jgi:hypothetical protein
MQTLSHKDKVSSKETMLLLNTSKNMHISSAAAMAHLAERLCLSALLMLKAENSRICHVGTQIPAVSMMEWQFILPL